MDRDDLLHKLHSLAQLDTDAVAVYEEALEHTTDEGVKTAFKQFQGEHRYHETKLLDVIEKLEGARTVLQVDLVGRVVEWITAIRASVGAKGALHAMQTAEHYHNRHYDDAVTWDVDADIADMLGRFDADEKRHLAFMEEHLHASAETAPPANAD